MQMDFALPRAQNTFVPLKNPTINETWVVCDWSLQQWLGFSSQSRAALGHPSNPRDTHQHSFPFSAPAQPWYCCFPPYTCQELPTLSALPRSSPGTMSHCQTKG